MPRSWSVELVLLLFCPLLSACPSSRSGHADGDAGGAHEPPARFDAGLDLETPVASLAELCERGMQLECARLAHCCGVSAPRADLCSAWLSTPLRPPVSRALYCTSNIADDAEVLERASQCLRALPELHEDCRLLRADDPVRERVEAQCAAVAPRPLLPSNGECPYGINNALCVSPPGTYSTCSPCSDGCIGKCTRPRTLAKAGERCGEDFQCAPPNICKGTAVPGSRVCEAAAADDAPCWVDHDCASGACSSGATPAEQGRCLAEGKAPNSQLCGQLQDVSEHGLFKAARPFWITERNIIWRDADQLVLTDKNEGGTGRTRRIALPAEAQRGLHGWWALDEDRLIWLDGQEAAHELSFSTERVRTIAVDLKPSALVLANKTLWLASEGCRQVRQLDAVDLVLTRAARVEPGSDAGVLASDSLLLSADQDAALCASGSDVWRVRKGATTVEHLLRLPETQERGLSQVKSLQQTASAWFLAVSYTLNSDQALFKISKPLGTLSALEASGDYGAQLIQSVHVDAFTGTLYMGDGRDVLVVVPTEPLVIKKLPLHGAYLEAGPVADERHLYWLAGSILMRREKSALF